jgi:hypothetical protein
MSAGLFFVAATLLPPPLGVEPPQGAGGRAFGPVGSSPPPTNWKRYHPGLGEISKNWRQKVGSIQKKRVDMPKAKEQKIQKSNQRD